MKLQPNSHYNILISYPGSIPTKFEVYLEPQDEFVSTTSTRRLLDTSIITFETNANGNPFKIIQTDDDTSKEVFMVFYLFIHIQILYKPILHVIPHVLSPSPGNKILHEDRYVRTLSSITPSLFSIILQPTMLSITPLLFKQIIVILSSFLFSSLLVHYLCLYTAFKKFFAYFIVLSRFHKSTLF